MKKNFNQIKDEIRKKVKAIYRPKEFALICPFLLFTPQAFAFTKLINGFKSVTSSYLIPLSGAIAGCAFIFYIVMSYFKMDEHKKSIGNVLALAILSTVGLELVNQIISSFS